MGERIRSHAAHLYFLALPDYLGKPNAVAIAADKPDAVKMAVALMKAGNDMVRAIGGRDMHPESCTVGGWLHFPDAGAAGWPSRAPARSCGRAPSLLWNCSTACPIRTSITAPEHFSLHNDKEYVSLKGTLKSADHEFKREDYLKFVQEYHEPDMTANFVVREGHSYMVGALAARHQQLRPAFARS